MVACAAAATGCAGPTGVFIAPCAALKAEMGAGAGGGVMRGMKCTDCGSATDLMVICESCSRGELLKAQAQPVGGWERWVDLAVDIGRPPNKRQTRRLCALELAFLACTTLAGTELMPEGYWPSLSTINHHNPCGHEWWPFIYRLESWGLLQYREHEVDERGGRYVFFMQSEDQQLKVDEKKHLAYDYNYEEREVPPNEGKRWTAAHDAEIFAAARSMDRIYSRGGGPDDYRQQISALAVRLGRSDGAVEQRLEKWRLRKPPDPSNIAVFPGGAS